jgi:hypothetical protein
VGGRPVSISGSSAREQLGEAFQTIVRGSRESPARY